MLLLCAGSLAVSAQNVKVRWLEKECDFGVVKEAAGDAHARVRFVNEGSEPVVVADVVPSCGCTVADYPKDPVAPGDTAVINVVYDTNMRPGKIAKTMRVYLGEYDAATIYLTGTVIGTPQTLDKLYPAEFGPIRLSDSMMSMGRIKHGEARHHFLNIYNQSPDSVSLSISTGSPALSAELAHDSLGPGDLTSVSVYFNSRDEANMGVLYIPLTVTASGPNGVTEAVAKTDVIVEPDFSDMTEAERRDAPNISVEPERLDLGEIAKKEMKISFNILNQGNNPLKISRAYSISGRVSLSKYPHEVKSGKSAKAEGSVNLDGLEPGPFKIPVTFVTNDPLNPLKEAYIIGILTPNP